MYQIRIILYYTCILYEFIDIFNDSDDYDYDVSNIIFH